jgi:Domain of unknown function (DUF4384)
MTRSRGPDGAGPGPALTPTSPRIGPGPRLGLPRLLPAAVLVFASACAGPNPTGLAGGRSACVEGPRQQLDCRGAIQQFSRDFKTDLSYLQTAQAGIGTTSTKLIEADALSSDLVQHYYQTCALYNACLIDRAEYVARTERLQAIQLEVRRTLASVGPLASGSQQNIQINPPLGGVSGPGAAPTPSPLGAAPGAGDATQAAAGSAPAAGSQERLDAILGILREGSKLLGQGSQAGAAPPAAPASATAAQAPPSARVAPTPQVAARPDLDATVRSLLGALQRDVSRRNPTRLAPRAVVGNFTEEGKPWASPLGALLQERVTTVMRAEGVFRPATGSQARGITVQQVAGVANPNDPAALNAMYGSDLVIAGRYRAEGEQVLVRLAAVDAQGTEQAQATATIPRTAVPEVVAAAPSNAAETGQVLATLQQLGARAPSSSRVRLITNRPGDGANFRLGEEIRYIVTSTVDGYLYLFHVDSDQNLLRIFPNQYQPEARIAADTGIEVPAAGAPFRFEASPPFGLETTFAIVTAVPLSPQEFQVVEAGFGKPTVSLRSLVTTRGIAVKAADAAVTGGAAETPALAWSYVTVLIRP